MTRPAKPDRLTDAQLLAAAAELVIRTQLGSLTMLQRGLHVGAGRAARLIADLERLGVLGPARWPKAREVLVRPEQLQQTLERIRDGAQ